MCVSVDRIVDHHHIIQSYLDGYRDLAADFHNSLSGLDGLLSKSSQYPQNLIKCITLMSILNHSHHSSQCFLCS